MTATRHCLLYTYTAAITLMLSSFAVAGKTYADAAAFLTQVRSLRP